jgi:hypothetical protein
MGMKALLDDVAMDVKIGQKIQTEETTLEAWDVLD